MACCLIALGSNLGDRAEQLRRATAELGRLPATRLVARSRWHETSPIGGPAKQGPFLNAAALISTSLAPAALHAELRRIEGKLGRQRSERWAARSLDADLLLYDAVEMETAELQIPHPRMAYRRFVLEPAAEVAPWMIHLDSGWTVDGLLQHLNHGAEVIAVAAADAAIIDGIVLELAGQLTLPVTGGEAVSGARPHLSRWTAEMDGAGAKRPKLLLAVNSSAGTDARPSRRMLQLPPTGPIAWIPTDFAEGMREAIAAVQSVWPALAS